MRPPPAKLESGGAWLPPVDGRNRSHAATGQQFGEIPGANGDAALAQFGENVTPDQHAMAGQSGLYANTYDPATNSAGGHNWMLQADDPEYTGSGAGEHQRSPFNAVPNGTSLTLGLPAQPSCGADTVAPQYASAQPSTTVPANMRQTASLWQQWSSSSRRPGPSPCRRT